MSDIGADGKSSERLVARSDGTFAIAMTLLVLDIRVASDLHADAFRDALDRVLPALGGFALSFTVLASFCRDHRRPLNLSGGVDGLTLRPATAGLGAIALGPLPTTLLSDYASRPLAVACYATAVTVIDLLELGLLLTIRRLPWTAARPIPRRAGRDTVMATGPTVLVFGATVPVAFASPSAARWTRPALIPVRRVLGRQERTHESRHGRERWGRADGCDRPSRSAGKGSRPPHGGPSPTGSRGADRCRRAHR
ncbi:TMEM175 family protein [Streptomyces sp. NBC_00859]|uniref:TMEM175 family protein n=1 Tax=Streptomyces sp. NBC_00859 TaxID=2903682 RepID=UPI003868E1BE|nr:TMEM175 family protein [Streptomyces sp. NBC_00859]